MTIADAELAARELRSLRGFYGLMASASAGARVEHLGDVQASVVPSSRIASLPNGVVYGSTSALVAALPRLPELYGELPYLVWLRPGDAEASRACAAAGLKADGRPQLMAGVLGEMDLEPRRAIDRAEVSWPEVCAINDTAYGLPPGAFESVFADVRDDAVRLYGTQLDGALASVLMVRDHGEDDLGVYLVATLAAARGRGLAGGLLRIALREALEAGGVTTTSLEASALGEPVYAALGYRRLGVLEQWERRL